jgi:hypothetical protein
MTADTVGQTASSSVNKGHATHHIAIYIQNIYNFIYCAYIFLETAGDHMQQLQLHVYVQQG